MTETEAPAALSPEPEHSTDYWTGYEAGRAAERRVAALKMADALNDVIHPALMKYIDAMKVLAKEAGRALYSALPGGPVINVGPLPRHEDSAQGIEARRAEPLCGSVHESPVGAADAP